jgi:AcrR family transcriptional regulator
LLGAVGELLAERGPRFALTEVAARAGVSTATAYRHFSDPSAAVDAFVADLIGDLLAAFDAVPVGVDPVAELRALCREWVVRAARWGAAAVYTRSPRGVLARRDGGDPLVVGLYDRLAVRVEAGIAAGVLPVQDVRFAVLMWATLLDERVVIDLVGSGWAAEDVVERLTGALLRVLGASGRVVR